MNTPPLPTSDESPIVDNSMLWTCTVCSTTVNIFSRDDHLASRGHIRGLRKRSREPEREPYLLISGSSTSEEGIATSSSGDLMAKQEKPQKPHDSHISPKPRLVTPALPLPAFAAMVPGLPFLKTSQCKLCARSFPHHLLQYHDGEYFCKPCFSVPSPVASISTTSPTRLLPQSQPRPKLSIPASDTPPASVAASQPEITAENWYCKVCDQIDGINDMATHLRGAQHRTNTIKQLPRKPLARDAFYCDVCSTTKKLVGLEGHITSMTHMKKMMTRQQEPINSLRGMADDDRDELDLGIETYPAMRDIEKLEDDSTHVAYESVKRRNEEGLARDGNVLKGMAGGKGALQALQIATAVQQLERMARRSKVSGPVADETERVMVRSAEIIGRTGGEIRDAAIESYKSSYQNQPVSPDNPAKATSSTSGGGANEMPSAASLKQMEQAARNQITRSNCNPYLVEMWNCAACDMKMPRMLKTSHENLPYHTWMVTSQSKVTEVLTKALAEKALTETISTTVKAVKKMAEQKVMSNMSKKAAEKKMSVNQTAPAKMPIVEAPVKVYNSGSFENLMDAPISEGFVHPTVLPHVIKQIQGKEIRTSHCEICDISFEWKDWHLHRASAWRCGLCDIRIHSNAKRVHLSGPDHTRRLQEQQATAQENTTTHSPTPEPPISQPVNTFFCQPCNQEFPTSELTFHESPSWHCTLCSITMHLDTKSMHEWSQKHTDYLNRAVAKASDQHRIAGTFHCTICDTTAELAAQEFHRSRAWECTICNIKTHTDWIGVHLASPEHAAKVPRPKTPEKFYCETCKKDCDVPHTTPGWECKLCNETMHIPRVENHVVGSKHISNLRRDRALKYIPSSAKPRISASNAPGMFYCELCEREFALYWRRGHSTPPWKCTICNEVTHIMSKESHLRAHAKTVEVKEEAKQGVSSK